MERQCWSQYSRWECLELSDLPESIKDSELEDTALKLFKKLNVEIESSSIEDFRRLPSIGPNRVIIKFSKRKDANSIRRVKKNLKGMDLYSTGIKSPVYVNDSLCKYKTLWPIFCVNKFTHLFYIGFTFVLHCYTFVLDFNWIHQIEAILE